VRQERLAGLVVPGHAHGAGRRVHDAGVGQQADAVAPGGFDHVTVLLHPDTRVAAGDQQQAGCALECRPQRGGIGVVSGAHGHPAFGEVLQPVEAAAGGDDLACGHAALQQALDGQAAELPGRARDNQGHKKAPSGISRANRPQSVAIPHRWYAL
jgi:hypothetical protein